MIKVLKFVIVVLVFISGCIYGAIILNIAGAQDLYYHSKYFRPYADLKEEQRRSQVIQLKDNRILLPNWQQTEIFDPYTKTSELMPGWDSQGIHVTDPKLTLLDSGNVMVTKEGHRGGGILCKGPRNGTDNCPPGKVPLFDIKAKIIQWIPFAIPDLERHEMLLLPDGNVLTIGGWIKNHYKESAQTLQGQPYSETNIFIYNPKTYKIKVLGRLQVDRLDAQAVLLDEQKVLVFGGFRTPKPGTTEGQHFARSPILFIENSVEMIDLKTGKSKIIGRLKYWVGNTVIPLGKGRYLFPQTGYEIGHFYSQIFDLKKPYETELIADAPDAPPYWAKSCAPLPSGQVICIGEQAVCMIDPNKGTIQAIDRLSSPPLIYARPIYVPRVGLLVFGAARYKNFYRDTHQRTIQRFDYERYLEDIREGSK